MFGFGLPEMVVILVILLVVFGAGKIPEISKAFGQGIRNFNNTLAGKDVIEINPKQKETSEKQA